MELANRKIEFLKNIIHQLYTSDQKLNNDFVQYIVDTIPVDRVNLLTALISDSYLTSVMQWAPNSKWEHDKENYTDIPVKDLEDKLAWPTSKSMLYASTKSFPCSQFTKMLEISIIDKLFATRNSEFKSILLLRLKSDNQRISYLLLESQREGAFSLQDQEFLLLFRDAFSHLAKNLPSGEESNAIAVLDKVTLSPFEMLCRCPSLKSLTKKLSILARSDSTVLILGESGVGKELIADSLHSLSPRRDFPLIKFNCAALPETLIDSVLFGYEKGAFTGAAQQHLGIFEQAHNGILFLDEVAELSPASQARLLRVLESKSFARIGGKTLVHINIRLIGATNRDLKDMVEKGLFREDLYYRLHVYPLHMPSIKDRPEDIPSLVQFFYSKLVHAHDIQNPPKISFKELANLCGYHWPGNIRQISNVMEQAFIDAIIAEYEHLDFSSLIDTKLSISIPEKNTLGKLREMNNHCIANALTQSKGRIQGPHGAATILGISPNTLRSHMRKYGIPLPREKTKA